MVLGFNESWSFGFSRRKFFFEWYLRRKEGGNIWMVIFFSF